MLRAVQMVQYNKDRLAGLVSGGRLGDRDPTTCLPNRSNLIAFSFPPLSIKFSRSCSRSMFCPSSLEPYNRYGVSQFSESGGSTMG